MMNKSKRVMALGSALVAIAMMAACTAPIPENGAMPTVTPQDNTAQIPDDPDADDPQGSAAQDNTPQEPAGRQGDGQAGSMRARGFMMDASALDDPDKPEGNPAYSGMVVSAQGDKLTILAENGAQETQESADGGPGNGRNAMENMEQKELAIAAGFRVKKAEFERPGAGENSDGNRDGDAAGASGAAKLTEITKEQLNKDDRITVWTDESGSAVYAIVMSGMNGTRDSRDGAPNDGRSGQRRDGDGGARQRRD